MSSWPQLPLLFVTSCSTSFRMRSFLSAGEADGLQDPIALFSVICYHLALSKGTVPSLFSFPLLTKSLNCLSVLHRTQLSWFLESLRLLQVGNDSLSLSFPFLLFSFVIEPSAFFSPLFACFGFLFLYQVSHSALCIITTNSLVVSPCFPTFIHLEKKKMCQGSPVCQTLGEHWGY